MNNHQSPYGLSDRIWCLDHEDAKGTKSTKREEHEGVRCRAHFLRVFALRVLRGPSCLRDPNTSFQLLIPQPGPYLANSLLDLILQRGLRDALGAGDVYLQRELKLAYHGTERQ
jgi:hypothetical protein